MNRSSNARSSALGSRAAQSARRAGRCSCIVARARCSALLVAATLVSSSCGGLDGRPAEHVAGDQRRTLPRRQHLHGGQEGQARSSRARRPLHRVGPRSARSRRATDRGTAAATAPRRTSSTLARGASGDGACRGRRSWRSDRATPGTGRCRRRCRGSPGAEEASPAPHPRPRRTRRACGSSGRAARAGGAR